MSCINKNHPDVAKLAGELNILPAVAAAKIGVWQEKNNNFDRFPTKDELVKSNKINYQNIQSVSDQGIIASEKTIRDLAARLADRIGITVKFESDRSKKYKGKIENNVAYINLAYATLDTPIHEILGHLIIRAIKSKQLITKKQQWKFNKPFFNDQQIKNNTGKTITYEGHIYEVYELKKFSNITYKAINFKRNEQLELSEKEFNDIVNESQLYQNLLKELETGRGKEVLDRIKKDYQFKESLKQITVEYDVFGRQEYIYKIDGKTFNDKNDAEKYQKENSNKTKYTLEEQQEEAIVELLGLMTAKKLDNLKDGELIHLLRILLKEMKQFVRSLINQKEVEIDKLPGNMTLGDLSDLLAYSNNKLILPGYEVVYSIGDALIFKTYSEINNHIKELARQAEKYENVDLTKIKIDSSDAILKRFLDSDEEYAQAREVIETWKKTNNIVYNPEEAYSRGQEFIHVHNAYGTTDTITWLQNLIPNLEDIKKANGVMEMSFLTYKQGELPNHVIRTMNPKAVIKIITYPKSKDIVFASKIDNHTSSYSIEKKGLQYFIDLSKVKKREQLAVSYTKSVKLHSLYTIEPNIATTIDDVAHHNEYAINIADGNFRIEYGEEVSYQVKKIIDGINKILDQKYGKLTKPIIKEGKINKYTVKDFQYFEGEEFEDFKDFDTLEEAEKYIESRKIFGGYRLKIEKYKGIQPTQTNETLKESIESVESKFSINFEEGYFDTLEVREYSDYFDDVVIEGFTINNYGNSPLLDELISKEPIFNTEKEAINRIKELIEKVKKIYNERKNNQKEYTSQALINTKIAALKEVAKKYPRSLITSEVKPISNQSSKNNENFFQLNTPNVTSELIEKEKQEFKEKGITLNQKNNIPIINKLLYRTITPATYNLKSLLMKGFYSLFVGRSYFDFINTINYLKKLNISIPEWAGNISEEQYNKRDDAWALSNGLPQKHNTFKYIGKGFIKENGSIEFNKNGEDIYDFVNPVFNDVDINKALKQGKTYASDDQNFVMGNYGISISRDDVGYFIRYIDRWDLDITNKFVQSIIDKTQKPFVVSGKLYKASTLDEEGNPIVYYTSDASNNDINSYTELMAQLDLEEEIKNDNLEYKKLTVSPKTIVLIKELIKKMGVDIRNVKEIFDSNGQKKDADGVAKLMQSIIEVVNGKEETALPEEALHFAVAIIKQTNPKLYKKLLSEINNYQTYKDVLKNYSTTYLDENGKPDIIKLKEEAIAQVLVQNILYKLGDTREAPELVAKSQAWWKDILDWIKGLITRSGIEQASLDIILGKEIGTVEDINEAADSDFFQLNNEKQTTIVDKITSINNSISKKEVMKNGELSDRYFIGDKEIKWRVSERIITWFKALMQKNALTDSEYTKAVKNLKAENGTKGHLDFEYAFKNFVNSDGTLKTQQEIDEFIKNDEHVSNLNPEDNSMYKLLRDNLLERMQTFNNEAPGTKFLAEVALYAPKSDMAGTVDFIAIKPNGKISILDWKFTTINDVSKDIPWYNIESWNNQMGLYKKMLIDNYGAKEADFEQTRMIPIRAEYAPGDEKLGIKPTLRNVQIGNVNVKNIEEDYLVPVALEKEKVVIENNAMASKEINSLLEKLNSMSKKLKDAKVFNEKEAEAKKIQMNNLMYSIRQLQMKQNIMPLLEQAKLVNEQVNNIINEFQEKYSGKTRKEFDASYNKEISDFENRLINISASLKEFKELRDEISFYLESKNLEEDEELKNELRETEEKAKKYYKMLNEVENEFATKIVGGANTAEKVIRGISKIFGTTATYQTQAFKVLYKLANQAFGFTNMDVQTEVKKLEGLKNSYQEWAKGKGLSVKNMFDVIRNDKTNKLIDEIKKEFYILVKEKKNTRDIGWLKTNIDVEAYKQHLKEKYEKEKEIIENKGNKYDSQDNSEIEKEIKLSQIRRLYDVSKDNSLGWQLEDINRFPLKEKWHTKEWIELNKPENKPALDFFNYIKERNTYYASIGYITNREARNFLPWVNKGLTEKMIFGGNITLGEQFLKSISIDDNEAGFGRRDLLTGQLVNSVPKHLINEMENIEDASSDLFKTMAMYNEFAIKFKYMSDIEGQIRALIRLEKNKKAIETSKFGKTKKDDQGNLVETIDNSVNAKLLEDVANSILYDQKYIASEDFDQFLGKLGTFGEKINNKLGFKLLPEDLSERQLSVNKIITSFNNHFQVVTLGLNVASAISNRFGGGTQSFINSGKFFTKAEHFAAQLYATANMFGTGDKRKKMLAALDYFIPFTENYNKFAINKLSLNKIDEGSIQDMLMWMMRESDRAVQTINFISFYNNAIVIDGKIQNVREYLRSTKEYSDMYKGTQEERKQRADKFEEDAKKLKEQYSLDKISEMNDGVFVIPNIERKSDSVIELRRNIQQFTADALGSMTEENKRMINMTLYGNSLMIFKNWIPRMADVRFGALKYNNASEAYEWGRMRTVARILIKDFSSSIDSLKSAITGNDEKWIEQMRKLYDEKRNSYFEETGKELEMSESDFIDLVNQNIKNQAMDVLFLAGLWIGFALLHANAPDDDEDPSVKNQYKFILKITDKLRDEIRYFYDPTSFTSLVSSSIFPSLRLLNNYKKVLVNFGKENYYILTENEKEEEKNHVIKYVMKSFPITNQASGYLPMLYPDLAKDLGIKMQSTSGIK